MPFLLALLGCCLLVVRRMWRVGQELHWLGLGFVCISAGVALQLVWRPASLLWFVQGFSVCYLLGFSGLGQALATRMGVRFPWRSVLLLSVVTMALQAWFSSVEPNLEVRVYLINGVCWAIMGVPLLQWRQMQLRNVFDQGLRVMYVLSIVFGMVRVVALLPVSQVQITHDFTSTLFWLWVHLHMMVVGLGLAVCMLCAVLRDLLSQLQNDRDIDVLTQLLNRRGWQTRLAQLSVQHGVQSAPSCSLLLADIDHFKRINDSLGHAAGDLVLQQVAHLLRQQVRGLDVVCRHGGEEFVVLLVGSGVDVAQRVAERIRQQIQQLEIAALRGQKLTISIGLAPLQGLEPQDVSRALEAADAQLYAAKHGGRNQVAVAEN